MHTRRMQSTYSNFYCVNQNNDFLSAFYRKSISRLHSNKILIFYAANYYQKKRDNKLLLCAHIKIIYGYENMTQIKRLPFYRERSSCSRHLSLDEEKNRKKNPQL